MKKIFTFFSFCLVCATLFAQYTVLHNFTVATGMEPASDLVLSKSKLFGTTYIGGAHDSGTIFSIDTSGNNYKVLYSFTKGMGVFPDGNITVIGNKIYGTTQYGGLNNLGVIFSIDTDGTSYKKLYDGNTPTARFPYGTTLIHNKLYGTTLTGGSGYYGNIYSIDTNGSNFKVMYTFTKTDGYDPVCNLLLVRNTLYGTTVYGGAGGYGNIFSIDTNGSNFKSIFSFNDLNGKSPTPTLLLSQNKLFGMTTLGGLYSDGNIYSIDTNGTTIKDIFDFNGSAGGNPQGGFVLKGSALLAASDLGGAHNSYGLLFLIDTNGNSYTDIHDFDGITGENSWTDLTPGGKNTYYGITSAGGSAIGVIFKFVNTDTTTGLNEPINPASFILSPNPNHGAFIIHSPANAGQWSGNSKVEIYNMLGMKIHSQLLANAPTNLVEIGSQVPGVYLYRIISEKGKQIATGKFVLE